MRKFKCIKNYPNGPDIETVVEYYNNWSMYGINYLCLYNKEDIENYPEFWQELIEKDYEITCYRSKLDSTLFFNKADGLSKFLNSDWEIYSIRRKSDGVEFKIGDKVYWNWQYSPQKYYTIEGFSINKEDNSLDFYTKGSCKYSWIFNKIQHYKEPILTTEDGYECTLDDTVFGVLPKANWQTNYYSGKGIPVFKLLTPEGKKWNPSSEWLWFKTKENAEKYIYDNKPEFSRKQIRSVIDNISSPLQYFDAKILKQNLGI